MRRIDAGALQPADVLMCMGSNPVLSWLLRNVDRGCYSHGTLYAGPGALRSEAADKVVAEARPGEGIWGATLEELQEHASYIDAYRFRWDELADPEGAPDRVVAAAANYVAGGGSFDIPYSVALVALGSVTAPQTEAREKAFEWLHRFNTARDGDSTSMVCTEFVYRCFLDAGVAIQVDPGTVYPESVIPSDFEHSASFRFLGRIYGPDDAPWPAAALEEGQADACEDPAAEPAGRAGRLRTKGSL